MEQFPHQKDEGIGQKILAIIVRPLE